jgi:hypothetical protein
MLNLAQKNSHLLIKIYGTIKVTYTKHYLTQGLRSRSPLQKFKLVAIEVLNKCNHRSATFDRTRLSGYFTTLSLYEFHSLGNLIRDHKDKTPVHVQKETTI